MLPSVWGRTTWHFLHIVSFFPKKRQEIYRSFFYYLQYLLPCDKCRHAYKEHIAAIPFPAKKEDMARWLIRVHNRVNQSIDKPAMEELEMLSQWEKEYLHVHSLPDTKFLDVASYLIEGHPGSRKMEEATIEAHLFFWKHAGSLLPSKQKEDLVCLDSFLETHPLTHETVRSKTKYRIWFRKLQKECHVPILSTRQSACTTICRV